MRQNGNNPLFIFYFHLKWSLNYIKFNIHYTLTATIFIKFSIFEIKTIMRILKTPTKHSPEDLKALMNTAKSSKDFKKWQILYISSCYKVTANYLSDTTGYSKASIYSIIKHPDIDINHKTRGGRNRELLPIKEEVRMMENMEDTAIKGQIISSKDMKSAVEAIVGKAVSDDYIWDLFKRNGWKKHRPGPNQFNNQQTDPKKRTKTIWLPLKTILKNMEKPVQ